VEKEGGRGAPDGPRYKALGNSMAVNVVRWIGEQIRAAL
jgi:DNA (cytosine-5)-methyltransferase 1